MDPIHQLPSPSFKKISLGTVVLVSFLVGGFSGAGFGIIASKGGLSKLLRLSGEESTEKGTGNGAATVALTEESTTIDVVKKVSPAVVSVVAKKDYSRVFGNQQNSPFDFFFGAPQVPQGQQDVGGGTGFIVTSDGMILTNKHVAELAQAADEFKVVTNDGKSYDAKVLATDPSTDIAVMKIDAKGLPTVTLGNSDSIQIGDTVVAIGNALGEYRNTVTKGIISGLARTIQAGDGSGKSETLHNVIQTDAAINPGNSGGPLLNVLGQAIGINTAINSQGQLIGFSLPINIAKRDLESVQKTGKIERPYLGVRYTLINDSIQQSEKLSVNYGALVSRGATAADAAVVPGGPADKAGIAENDIILEVDGQKVNEENDLSQFLIDKSVGQTVTLKILSKGKEKTVQVKLEARSQ